jgi:hypothetical protein
MRKHSTQTTRTAQTDHGSPSQPGFVNAHIIGKIYGISPRYVLKLASENRIPSLRLGAKCIRFDAEAVAIAMERYLSAAGNLKDEATP